MGYITKFSGKVVLSEKLSEAEVDFFTRWAFTMRCKRSDFTEGCYFALSYPYSIDDYRGHSTPNIIGFDNADGQPNAYCQWIVGKDKKSIHWDGVEKFHASAKWMAYIIEHFFGENPMAKRLYPEEFSFLRGNVLNGEIYAKGEDRSDVFKIEVLNNRVCVRDGDVPESGNVSRFNVDWHTTVEEVLCKPTERERVILSQSSLDDVITKSRDNTRVRNKL